MPRALADALFLMGISRLTATYLVFLSLRCFSTPDCGSSRSARYTACNECPPTRDIWHYSRCRNRAGRQLVLCPSRAAANPHHSSGAKHGCPPLYHNIHLFLYVNVATITPTAGHGANIHLRRGAASHGIGTCARPHGGERTNAVRTEPGGLACDHVADSRAEQRVLQLLVSKPGMAPSALRPAPEISELKRVPLKHNRHGRALGAECNGTRVVRQLAGFILRFFLDPTMFSKCFAPERNCWWRTDLAHA
jgi:hypothetical protein